MLVNTRVEKLTIDLVFNEAIKMHSSEVFSLMFKTWSKLCWQSFTWLASFSRKPGTCKCCKCYICYQPAALTSKPNSLFVMFKKLLFQKKYKKKFTRKQWHCYCQYLCKRHQKATALINLFTEWDVKLCPVEFATLINNFFRILVIRQASCYNFLNILFKVFLFANFLYVNIQFLCSLYFGNAPFFCSIFKNWPMYESPL
jgi:hypothetical protein